MSHPELAQEQAYVDHAYEALDKMRSILERTGDAMATEFAAVAMEAWVKRRHRTFQDAERGLCFGRLTLDQTLRPLYVGRRWVHDDDHEVLVVNWQAPAARPFYTATPHDPQRVTQRRRYRTEGRRIVDISDESLDGTALEGALVSDFLLEELERRREGRMRDIVATIQSGQLLGGRFDERDVAAAVGRTFPCTPEHRLGGLDAHELVHRWVVPEALAGADADLEHSAACFGDRSRCSPSGFATWSNTSACEMAARLSWTGSR